MKLTVELDALHRAVAPMVPQYILVHSSESPSYQVGLSHRYERNLSPLRAALYCQFYAEAHLGAHLSTTMLSTLLDQYYGFIQTPVRGDAVEIDMAVARDNACVTAAALLEDVTLFRDELFMAMQVLLQTASIPEGNQHASLSV